MNDFRLSTAVDAALPNLPIVLCRLTAEYAYRAPHRWHTDPMIRLDGPLSEHKQQAVYKSESNGSTSRLQLTDSGRPSNPWITFVSDIGFGDGALKWSVVGRREKLAGWIGTGVSNAETGAINLFNAAWSGVSIRSNWIARRFAWIDNIRPDDSITDVYHNGERTDCIIVTDAAETNRPSDDRIDFTADPVGLRITATFDSVTFIVVTVATIDEFNSLRPCVVLSGKASAVIESES